MAVGHYGRTEFGSLLCCAPRGAARRGSSRRLLAAQLSGAEFLLCSQTMATVSLLFPDLQEWHRPGPCFTSPCVSLPCPGAANWLTKTCSLPLNTLTRSRLATGSAQDAHSRAAVGQPAPCTVWQGEVRNRTVCARCQLLDFLLFFLLNPSLTEWRLSLSVGVRGRP